MALSRSMAKPLTPSRCPPCEELGSSSTASAETHIQLAMDHQHRRDGDRKRPTAARISLERPGCAAAMCGAWRPERKGRHTVAYPLTRLLGHGGREGDSAVMRRPRTGRLLWDFAKGVSGKVRGYRDTRAFKTQRGECRSQAVGSPTVLCWVYGTSTSSIVKTVDSSRGCSSESLLWYALGKN
jgi:hypothetical protein